jgi:curved DNA-binding protein CbpA
MKKTLYDLLGVPLAASRADIAAAYERLQRKFDPEAPENRGNPDVEVQFKAIREAYTILSSPERRDAYDASLAHLALPLDIPPPEEKKPFLTTNRMLVLALAGLIGFAAISQAIIQWRALQLSKQAMEQNEAYRGEVAERERLQTYGDESPEAVAARAEAERERRLEREEETRQRQLRYEEERQRREMEDARRYGASVASELSRTEEAARRREENEQQRREAAQRYEREQQEGEALRRLEAEKRRLRELEYQNRR